MTHAFTGLVQRPSDLREIYKMPTPVAIAKEIALLDHHCRQFIALSPFLCISTTGPTGADISPRGGQPGFVGVLDDGRIAVPDRPGNNRLDSLVNILHEPRVGLIFLVPGFEDVLRVNGTARIFTDPSLMERFSADGKLPLTVMVIDVKEAQMHCAKAVRRAGLWDQESKRDRTAFPSLGRILHDQLALDRDVQAIDESLENSNRTTLY